jgi:transposase
MAVAEAKSEIEYSMGSRPQGFGLVAVRWTLKNLCSAVSCLNSYSVSGAWRVLRRLGVRHVRARHHVHSPDPLYQEKFEHVLSIVRDFDPERQVLYFFDQVSVYLQPSASYDWVESGVPQPLARQGHKADKALRICGALNAFTGAFESIVRNQITVPALVEFFKTLTHKHPGKTLHIVLDNWPVHVHPNVLVALQVQLYPFERKVPASWANLKPQKKYLKMNLPVQLHFLPTYASWLNPIEKAWKMLKQDLVHNHPFTDRFDVLKKHIVQWCNKPPHEPNSILRYVGLLAHVGLYSNAFNCAFTNMSKNV